jgi:hypothetical protein
LVHDNRAAPCAFGARPHPTGGGVVTPRREGVRHIGRARQGSPSFSALLTLPAYKMATERIESSRPVWIASRGSRLNLSLFLSRFRAVEGGSSCRPSEHQRQARRRTPSFPRPSPASPRPAVPPRLASHLRLMSGLPASPQTPAALRLSTPASKADRTRRRLPSQADALSTRSKRSNVGQGASRSLASAISSGLPLLRALVPKHTNVLWAFSWMALGC